MDARAAVRLYLAIAALLLAAAPASAQFTPRSLNDPATGEIYHIEGAVGFWNPGSDMTLASAGRGPLSGIPGTAINFKKDLGLTDSKFPERHVTFRPVKKHKFRFQYIPISYGEEGIRVSQPIVFNGQQFRIGVPVNWTLDWRAYRFGYEYDAYYSNRVFVGFVADLKYTDVHATLVSPTTNEFERARAPIPALGGIVRGYVVPNISITGEVTGFKLPDKAIRDAEGHYVDVDIYGTVNFNDHVGGQMGYRSFNVGYAYNRDSGDFKLKGLYFGVVARY